MTNPLRCTDVNKSGVRCGLPAGHTTQHGNGTMVQPWSDEPEQPGLYEATNLNKQAPTKDAKNVNT